MFQQPQCQTHQFWAKLPKIAAPRGGAWLHSPPLSLLSAGSGVNDIHHHTWRDILCITQSEIFQGTREDLPWLCWGGCVLGAAAKLNKIAEKQMISKPICPLLHP